MTHTKYLFILLCGFSDLAFQVAENNKTPMDEKYLVF